MAYSQQPQEQVNGNEGPIKSIVNKQYNTPVAMYSDETIAETLSSQAEVLAGGVLGVNFKKNERVYSPANSEVYKLLHEQGDEPEPGNEDMFHHYYALACMLKLLNDGDGNIFTSDRLID
ncbi:hypothetical protein RP20_CCG003186 [Aedes albopictus]|nr:hypothetical protein RP20_CCG003186 [Aedes albopictus]